MILGFIPCIPRRKPTLLLRCICFEDFCVYALCLFYSGFFFPFFLLFCLFMVPRKYSSHKMSWKLFPLSFIFRKRWLRIGQSYSLLVDETLHFSSHSPESYYFERSLIMFDFLDSFHSVQVTYFTLVRFGRF